MSAISDQDKLYWLALTRSRRVGPSTFRRLLGEYGSPEAAYRALPEIAKQMKATQYQPFALDHAKREFDLGAKLGLSPLFLGQRLYPKRLASCADAPAFLWAKGQINTPQDHALAIVGARNASSLGQRVTKQIAANCAKAGLTIISGMARGIDTAAHQASLGRPSIAILAGGADIPYPRENAKLYEQICESGMILSEQPPQKIAQARHFPQRNRIIAGLAQGVLVIEGAAKSGSLITARDAADIGREVMAMPGHPMDARSAGCNFLIRDGATLVRSAEDVIEVIGQPKQQSFAFEEPTPKPPPPKRRPVEIMNMLTHTGISEDILMRETGLSPNALAQALTELELNGQIERQAGGRIARIA